jgi:hypothetical protein
MPKTTRRSLPSVTRPSDRDLAQRRPGANRRRWPGRRRTCSLVPMTVSQLPAAEIIEQGLSDLARGAETGPSLLVSIGAPRLRSLGLRAADPIPDADLRLYRRLAREHGNAAHSRYNALVRLLVSYERAAACVK